MATNIYAAVLEVLTPLVGRPIADICIRSSSASIGKNIDLLGLEDLPHIARTIRESLGAFTTQALLDAAIDDIADRVGG